MNTLVTYYKVRGKDWSAGFIDQTQFTFEIRISGDIMNNYRTGKYLYLWKIIDGIDWENLDSFTSISSAITRLREELDLPPLPNKEESTEKFCDITKWG